MNTAKTIPRSSVEDLINVLAAVSITSLRLAKRLQASAEQEQITNSLDVCPLIKRLKKEIYDEN